VAEANRRGLGSRVASRRSPGRLSGLRALTAGGEPLRSDDPLRKWLGIGVLAGSAIVLVSWLLIAVAHVHDTYRIDHVSGTWIALARYLNEGTLYPPLFDGHVFGGTRYMPLQFVLHAGLQHVTGEYIASGKLIVYASSLALFALLFVIARRLSGSAVLAIGLVAAVLGTDTGLSDSTAIRADALPVALQLGAVYLVARRAPAISTRAAAAAGLLCALALFTKLTALWAPIALVAWLAVRAQPRLAVFLASFLGVGAVLFAIFEFASDGRMTKNVIGLAAAGAQLSGRDTLTKIAAIGQSDAFAAWVLAPFAIAAVGAGIARRRLSVYQLALAAAALIVLIVLRDVGTDLNHLLDVEVLTALVVAEAVPHWEARLGAFMWSLVLAAIFWGTASSYQIDFRPETQAAFWTLAGHGDTFHTGPELAGVITRRDRILSEDPYVELSLGENPTVLDAFMLIRIGDEHPAWRDDLVGRIERRAFTKIVLQYVLDPRSRWYRVYSLGGRVTSAIAANYRLAKTAPDPREGGDYYVYVPKTG
jgi:hypothetical protein